MWMWGSRPGNRRVVNSVIMKTLRHKRRSIVARSKFFKSRMDIVEDKSKCTILAGELALKLINVHPADRDASNIVCLFIIIVSTSMHVGLMYSCLLENNDVDAIANILVFSNGGMQTIIKAVALFYNRKGFTSILETLRHSFWPANTVDPNTEKQIWTSSKTLIVLFLFLYVVPVASLAFFLILPILKGIRSLPYTYCLLSDRTRESPMFEMMYAFQTIAVIFLPVNVLAGHDYMYNAFCANCSAQFRLLHSAIRFVGSGNEDEMIQRLSELPGVEAPSPRKQDNKAKILLVICIKHHQNLLSFIDTLNEIYEPSIFLQFVLSLAGICANCYLLTLQTNMKASASILFIYFACLLQLFLICRLSDNLSQLSADLADAAYESMWYKNLDPDVAKCIRIVILRSQKAICMNAFGLFQLNCVSFMSVVRFSFSLYTFLTQVAT